MFEVALGKKLCNAMEFNDLEILQILSENLRLTMNLVPNCIEEIQNQNKFGYDPFQSLEFLNGLTVSDFFICDPDMLSSEVHAVS